MTIAQVLTYGKPFKRKGWASSTALSANYTFTPTDLMATDWFVEEPIYSLTVTAMKSAWLTNSVGTDQCFVNFCKSLGITDFSFISLPRGVTL